MVMIASEDEASCDGVAATFAPAAASGVVFSWVRFQTASSWPRPIRRWAIAEPILPVPATPIFKRSSFARACRVDTCSSVGSNYPAINITVAPRPLRSEGEKMGSPKSELRDGMRIDWDVPIEMEDDLVLRADVFRPEKDGRYPVILSYGPYAKGLALKDFYHCIEWAGSQTWSNGKVGLNGISYYAINQWHVASLQPPHLAAMCIWEGAADWYRDMTHHGGILSTFWANWYDMQVKTVQYGLGE